MLHLTCKGMNMLVSKNSFSNEADFFYIKRDNFIFAYFYIFPVYSNSVKKQTLIPQKIYCIS